MSSKKLLGIKKPSKYIIITEPDGGHTRQQANYITLQQAKKTIKE